MSSGSTPAYMGPEFSIPITVRCGRTSQQSMSRVSSIVSKKADVMVTRRGKSPLVVCTDELICEYDYLHDRDGSSKCGGKLRKGMCVVDVMEYEGRRKGSPCNKYICALTAYTSTTLINKSQIWCSVRSDSRE